MDGTDDKVRCIAGCNRYIKKDCDCGGKGEILMTILGGYVVRCNKCHKSTKQQDNVIDAAKDWNAAELPWQLHDVFM